MSPRPKTLDELGRELVRAARAAEADGARGAVRARTPRAFVIGLLALLGLAAAATAATLIIGRGDPIPPARSGDVPLELRPVAGSARLNGLDVADPDGGPLWDVRTSRSRTGAVCTTVGQVLDGELGLVGLDRRFRALPAGAADTCSTPQRRGATLAGARAFRGGGKLSALTVVNGVAAPAVRRATAVAGGRTVRMRLGPGHAFLAVFRGLPEQVRPRVVLTEAAGRRTTLRFADRGEFIALDPSGGAPWALHYSVGRHGLGCVSAQRQRGMDSPLPSVPGAFNLLPSSVPPRCGRRTRAFVAIRRFVPRNQRTGRAFWWGLNPSRTVVWGAVPPATRAVVLSGAGAPQRITVDARRGGFLAVLDGRVDPRRLRVSADGRALDATARRSAPKGQPIAPAPVPAWRSVASVATRAAIPEPYLTKRGSVAISRRADDPTGGPAWALRSWAARINPRARVSGSGGGARDLLCFAIGIERGDRLVEPRAGADDPHCRHRPARRALQRSGLARQARCGQRGAHVCRRSGVTRSQAGPARDLRAARVRRAFRRAARRRCPACARAGAARHVPARARTTARGRCVARPPGPIRRARRDLDRRRVRHRVQAASRAVDAGRRPRRRPIVGCRRRRRRRAHARPSHGRRRRLPLRRSRGRTSTRLDPRRGHMAALRPRRLLRCGAGPAGERRGGVRSRSTSAVPDSGPRASAPCRRRERRSRAARCRVGRSSRGASAPT